MGREGVEKERQRQIEREDASHPHLRAEAFCPTDTQDQGQGTLQRQTRQTETEDEMRKKQLYWTKGGEGGSADGEEGGAGRGEEKATPRAQKTDGTGVRTLERLDVGVRELLRPGASTTLPTLVDVGLTEQKRERTIFSLRRVFSVTCLP